MKDRIISKSQSMVNQLLFHPYREKRSCISRKNNQSQGAKCITNKSRNWIAMYSTLAQYPPYPHSAVQCTMYSHCENTVRTVYSAPWRTSTHCTFWTHTRWTSNFTFCQICTQHDVGKQSRGVQCRTGSWAGSQSPETSASRDRILRASGTRLRPFPSSWN